MKRRSFVKKSISASILTPLAFTGLISAAGADPGGGTETTWFTTEATWTTSDPPPSSDPPPLYDPETELGWPGIRPGDCDGNCNLSGWFKCVAQGGGMCCWREVTGCAVDGQQAKTYSWVEQCPTGDPSDPSFDLAKHTWCLMLQNKPLPQQCPQSGIPV